MVTLFVFSGLSPASAVAILREKRSTNLSDFLMTLAFVIWRGISLIVDRLKATTSTGLSVITAVIAAFSAAAAFQLDELRFSHVQCGPSFSRSTRICRAVRPHGRRFPEPDGRRADLLGISDLLVSLLHRDDRPVVETSLFLDSFIIIVEIFCRSIVSLSNVGF
jgi:hypothetical protein